MVDYKSSPSLKGKRIACGMEGNSLKKSSERQNPASKEKIRKNEMQLTSAAPQRSPWCSWVCLSVK